MCTLPSFPNWATEATTGDGSCIDSLDVFGCTDSLYLEYNSNANIDNGLCNIISVIGCMDNLACNYNSLINLDDGSCYYPDQGYDCDGDSIQQDVPILRRQITTLMLLLIMELEFK